MNLEQIDTSTTAGKAEVMRAESFRVRWRVKGDSEWLHSPVEWNWDEHQYAIVNEEVSAGGPEEVWVILDSEGDVLSACKHEWEVRVKMHIDCGASALRYIRADLAGEKGE
ncbi:hypothetical protein [Stenotrophomonas maltophilia]|uniref:hypothetical protein n=1 Tax=Stenotrophomonas maltophilia TaxID=40324 RepID=UPI0015DD7040|nr:hypothetical protein [Stenotrophomonas maltophilia]MBA0362386.1 hypothetical protein [Stenotrophomonas maltophilia]